MTKAYPSNLTQAQYELLSDMIPEAKSGGRPRSVKMWDVINAIFYVLVEGVQQYGSVKPQSQVNWSFDL